MARPPRSPTRTATTVTLSPSLSSRRRLSATMNHSETNLSAVARHTRRKIKWDRILRGSDARATQWKWLENARNFSIYAKEDNGKDTAVLAIGVVKGAVPEIASLLKSSSQEEYVLKMEAMYDGNFKTGQLIHEVPYEPEHGGEDEAENIEISVRTATFEKTGGWLASHDEWHFLEATSYRPATQRFEKQLTTLKPHDVFPLERKSSSKSGTKSVRDVIAGYRVEPDQSEDSALPEGMEDGRVSHQPEAPTKRLAASRIHFYAAHSSSSPSGPSSSPFGRFSVPKSRREASDKAIRQRLLHFAKGCDRLSLLVRRRRLGMQVVVDQKRVMSSLNTRCFNCDKSLRLIAKLCRICGQGVCGDCSSKYERESHVLGGKHRVRLEDVRVCDPCLTRVDNSDFSNISDAALIGPTIFPNPDGAQPPSADLKGLLQDALLSAPSPQRKGAVMSVIRCVLDQEKIQDELTPPTTPSPTISTIEDASQKRFTQAPVLLTPVSGDKEYVDALDYLEVKAVAHTVAEISANEGRAYVMDSRKGEPDAALTFPVPDNEAQRVEAINRSMMLDTGTMQELDIICEIASKEVNSFASLITLITQDEQRVIGANMEMLASLTLKREDAFCAHTIMDDKPLVVPHPESDIRFSRILPVTGMGARYYCGFPIVADDEYNTVIGSLCCIDNKQNALTESQYAVLKKLANTASKLVRIEGAKRRSSSVSKRPSNLTTSQSTERANLAE